MKYGLYVGAISGTSMDGIDTVLLEIDADGVRTLENHSNVYPDELQNELHALCSPGPNEIFRSGQAHVQVGRLIAKTVNELLEKAKLAPAKVRAIGSHGQTIRHHAETQPAFSLQIGDPSSISHLTGIATVADFRMADIAAGGQGAPLAPAFHHAVFSHESTPRIIVNLGGIANLTLLSPESEPLGYDTGPANTLMDQWINRCHGKEYDENGGWARSGAVNHELLERLLAEPYLALPAPKSTGRELFNLNWLEQHIDELKQMPEPENIQHTLLEYSAVTVAEEISKLLGNKSTEVYLCGGGVHNDFLVERLGELLPTMKIQTTAALGVDTQQVEASAFAWMAFRTINHLHGNLKTVTGATKDKILGGIYLP